MTLSYTVIWGPYKNVQQQQRQQQQQQLGPLLDLTAIAAGKNGAFRQTTSRTSIRDRL